MTRSAVRVSDLDMLKIISAREAQIGADHRLEENRSELAQARETFRGRQETEQVILDELAALREAGDSKELGETVDRLNAAAADRKRALESMETASRNYKRQHKQCDELAASLVHLVDAAFGLGDKGQLLLPRDDSEYRPNPDAWKLVTLDTLMGPTFAAPFADAGVSTVGDAFKSLSGKFPLTGVDNQPLAAPLMAYLRAKVADFLDRRGIKHKIEHDPAAELPGVEKVDAELADAKEDAAERYDGDPEGDAGQPDDDAGEAGDEGEQEEEDGGPGYKFPPPPATIRTPGDTVPVKKPAKKAVEKATPKKAAKKKAVKKRGR